MLKFGYFWWIFCLFLINILNKQIQDIRCDEEREKEEKERSRLESWGGGGLSRVWGRNMI